MSRSKHQTVKGVFGGKSVAEINAAVAELDEDVEALAAKKRLKKEERGRRARESALRTGS